MPKTATPRKKPMRGEYVFVENPDEQTGGQRNWINSTQLTAPFTHSTGENTEILLLEHVQKMATRISYPILYSEAVRIALGNLVQLQK